MNLSDIAKQLGQKGGLARSKNLSTAEKKEIAFLAAQTRWLSAKAADRLMRNLHSLRAVQVFRKIPQVVSVSRVYHRLPGIYVRQ